MLIKKILLLQENMVELSSCPEALLYILPKGEGISDLISGITNFVGQNKDAIGALGSVTGAISNVAKTGIDIAKGVQEVENLKALRNSASTKKLEQKNALGKM